VTDDGKGAPAIDLLAMLAARSFRIHR
jgi:hypothetical protein